MVLQLRGGFWKSPGGFKELGNVQLKRLKFEASRLGFFSPELFVHLSFFSPCFFSYHVFFWSCERPIIYIIFNSWRWTQIFWCLLANSQPTLPPGSPGAKKSPGQMDSDMMNARENATMPIWEGRGMDWFLHKFAWCTPYFLNSPESHIRPDTVMLNASKLRYGVSASIRNAAFRRQPLFDWLVIPKKNKGIN